MLTKLTINLLQKYKQKFEDMSIISGLSHLCKLRNILVDFDITASIIQSTSIEICRLLRSQTSIPNSNIH